MKSFEEICNSLEHEFDDFEINDKKTFLINRNKDISFNIGVDREGPFYYNLEYFLSKDQCNIINELITDKLRKRLVTDKLKQSNTDDNDRFKALSIITEFINNNPNILNTVNSEVINKLVSRLSEDIELMLREYEYKDNIDQNSILNEFRKIFKVWNNNSPTYFTIKQCRENTNCYILEFAMPQYTELSCKCSYLDIFRITTLHDYFIGTIDNLIIGLRITFNIKEDNKLDYSLCYEDDCFYFTQKEKVFSYGNTVYNNKSFNKAKDRITRLTSERIKELKNDKTFFKLEKKLNLVRDIINTIDFNLDDKEFELRKNNPDIRKNRPYKYHLFKDTGELLLNDILPSKDSKMIKYFNHSFSDLKEKIIKEITNLKPYCPDYNLDPNNPDYGLYVLQYITDFYFILNIALELSIIDYINNSNVNVKDIISKIEKGLRDNYHDNIDDGRRKLQRRYLHIEDSYIHFTKHGYYTLEMFDRIEEFISI